MLARFAVLAAAFGLASAQLKVLAPGGPDLWWVANSENNIVWNCKESQVQNFTILISNTNPNILVAPQAIIAVQNNFDCSRTITTQQAAYQPANGYQVILANPINSTDVYAQSEVFEVRALGSAYPATSATPGNGASETGTATGSAASGSSTGSSSAAIANAPRAVAAVGAALAGVAAFAL